MKQPVKHTNVAVVLSAEHCTSEPLLLVVTADCRRFARTLLVSSCSGDTLPPTSVPENTIVQKYLTHANTHTGRLSFGVSTSREKDTSQNDAKGRNERRESKSMECMEMRLWVRISRARNMMQRSKLTDLSAMTND